MKGGHLNFGSVYIYFLQCMVVKIYSIKHIFLSYHLFIFSVEMGNYEVLENVHLQDLWDMTHHEDSLLRRKGSYSDSYPF